MTARMHVVGFLTAVIGVAIASPDAGAAPRHAREARTWSATALAGDAARAGADVDTFRVRHRRGDRMLLTLQRTANATADARFTVTLRVEGGDAGRAIVRHARGKRARFSHRFRKDGTYTVSIETPPVTGAGPALPPPQGIYNLRVETDADLEVVTTDALPLEPQPDVERPVVNWPLPGGPEPVVPPVPPTPPPPPPPLDPAPMPALLNCTLSGASSSATSWHVDDALDLYVDGVLVYTDGMNGSGTRAPVTFQAYDGSQVRVVCRDWYGIRAWVSDLYILVDRGPTVLVTNMIDLGWGRPMYPADGGLFFDTTVTLRAK